MSELTALKLYRYDFLSFVRFVFHELYPGKEFVDGWYLDVIADGLMRCAPGGERRLMINVPPRHLKSLCASIAWPLFVLAHHPGRRIFVCAGTRELGAEFNEQRERLLKSPRLLRVFPMLRAAPIANGFRFSNGSELVQTIVGRSQIGRGADIIVIDDPISPSRAKAPHACEAVNNWYDAEVLPRLNNKRSAAMVVVMQRLAPRDLCGHLLAGTDNWRHVALSAVARNDEQWVTSEGAVYRRAAQEVLCPELESRDALLEQLAQMGGMNFYAQYLQRPTSAPDGTNLRHSRRPITVVPLDWKHGEPKINRQVFTRIDIAYDVRHEYFGEQLPDHMDGLRPQTREEFEYEFWVQQTASIASMKADRARREAVRLSEGPGA